MQVFLHIQAQGKSSSKRQSRLQEIKRYQMVCFSFWPCPLQFMLGYMEEMDEKRISGAGSSSNKRSVSLPSSCVWVFEVIKQLGKSPPPPCPPNRLNLQRSFWLISSLQGGRSCALDKNFKPYHTLFCYDLRTFRKSLDNKMFFRSKTVFLGPEVHYHSIREPVKNVLADFVR